MKKFILMKNELYEILLQNYNRNKNLASNYTINNNFVTLYSIIFLDYG